jgi:hypothetical protein
VAQPPERTPFSARQGRRCRCRNFVRVVATGSGVQHRCGRNWLPPERSAEGLAGLGWTGPRGCLNEAAFSSSAGVLRDVASGLAGWHRDAAELPTERCRRHAALLKEALWPN